MNDRPNKKSLTEKEGFSNFMASVLAILCGLAIGFVVLLIADPVNAFPGLVAILTGGLSDLRNLGQVLYAATPIILTGLSVGFANKTGLFTHPSCRLTALCATIMYPVTSEFRYIYIFKRFKKLTLQFFIANLVLFSVML